MEIGKSFLTLEIQKPNIQNIQDPEPSQKVKMGCFVKIVKSYNYFFKALYLRSLTGF